MSEMTRERIKDYIRRYEGTADFGTVRSFSADEQYELAKLALSALTARSEGFREGVEAAAKVCDAYLWAPVCAAAIRALSPRETDAQDRCDHDVVGSHLSETDADPQVQTADKVEPLPSPKCP